MQTKRDTDKRDVKRRARVSCAGMKTGKGGGSNEEKNLIIIFNSSYDGYGFGGLRWRKHRHTGGDYAGPDNGGRGQRGSPGF
jgi:hypothetical protein